MSRKSSAAPVLVPLAKVVIEAALEAELVEHLAGQTDYFGPGAVRRNSRNGTRPKTIRTAVGPITLEVPRDRWGSFEPLTVGKWQREVVGIDRVLPLLAAHGVPTSDIVSMLARAYPHTASSRLLSRIATNVQAHLRAWHDRRVPGPFPALHVHVHLPTPDGRATGGPGHYVVSVVGTRAPDAQGLERRELLSLRAVPSVHHRQAWRDVVGDLHSRQLGGVHQVVGAGAAPFSEAASAFWPLEDASTALSA